MPPKFARPTPCGHCGKSTAAASQRACDAKPPDDFRLPAAVQDSGDALPVCGRVWRKGVGPPIIRCAEDGAAKTTEMAVAGPVADGSLAQLVEQRTLNPLVVGSNPTRPTTPFTTPAGVLPQVGVTLHLPARVLGGGMAGWGILL